MVKKTNTVSKIYEGDTTPLRDKARLIHIQRQLSIFEDWADELELEGGDLLREAISEGVSLSEKLLENFE